jgi:hypothetical protein
VLFGASPRRTGSALARTRPSRHMTIEEVEDVVRALTAVVEKLEASAAKQSIQEAFMQAHAYADEMLASASIHRRGNDGTKHGLFRSNNAEVLVRSHEDGSVISD